MLEQKKIVIIGGTSGIGLSASKAFIKHGAKVCAVGLDEPDFESAETYTYKIADARNEETAEQAIELCIKEYGGFDGLFHVAGGSGRKWGDGPLHGMTIEAWQKTLDLNLTSVMLSNRAAIRHFLYNNQSGTILNTSTVLAFSPLPKYFYTHAYTTAKAALIGFSKSIAAYYASHSIRVNVLAPGLVNTPMAQRAMNNDEIRHFVKSKQPLDGGRVEEAQDLDGAACYFMSDSSKFTTGQVLSVDGGWTVSDGQYS